MKTLATTLMALIVGLLVSGPVLATNGAQADTVTKTFKLTLSGDIPADQQFAVFYAPQGEPPQVTGIQFCGPKAEAVEGAPPITKRVTAEDCTGNGTVYTVDVEFPRGTKLLYAFDTGLASVPEFHENFAKSFDGEEPDGPEDFETLDTDMTNSAEYRPGLVQLPATGAASITRTSLLLSTIVATIMLLIVGGYMLRRPGV